MTERGPMKKLTIRLDADEAALIERLARLEKRTVSSLVRYVLTREAAKRGLIGGEGETAKSRLTAVPKTANN